MSRPTSQTRELIASESGPPCSGPPAEAGAGVLERLLCAVCAAPVEEGCSATARFLIGIFGEILPDFALGVCLGGSIDADRVFATRDTQPWEIDPPTVRLFRGVAHERAFSVPDGLGSVLHCGCDDPLLTDDESDLVRLLGMCARVMGASLRTAAAIESSRRNSYEIRQLQAALVQIHKMASLGEISAGIVHELANPLTSIVAYSDYLIRKAERNHAETEDIERLNRIGTAADRILKFARALTSYARPSGETPASNDLNDIIDKALVFCDHIICESNVEVSRESPEPLPVVTGISGQLIQVFVNLITNACQAMSPEGGQLRIRTEPVEHGRSVMVTLVDSGPGIRGDLLVRIFEPFFTTKEQSKGTGLGLSIVRYILASHGGEVGVDSTPGNGASFRVVLPSHCTRQPPNPSAQGAG
jgi:two-component system, NtrC family, sensor kinase